MSDDRDAELTAPPQRDIDAWRIEAETCLRFGGSGLGRFRWPQAILSLIAENDRSQAALARSGNLAAMCRQDMQGRLLDDEHRRAFDVLGCIQREALGGNND